LVAEYQVLYLRIKHFLALKLPFLVILIPQKIYKNISLSIGCS